MNMLNYLVDIIRRLFGKRVVQSELSTAESRADVRAYEDVTRENLTALFASSLSSLAMSDSSVTVTSGAEAPTRRSELLDGLAQRQWATLKQDIAVGLGCGMIVSLPYCTNGRLYIDTVPKDRAFITGACGNEVTAVTVLADTLQYSGSSAVYCRWVDYEAAGGVYTIRQKATKNGTEVPIGDVAEWSDIPEEIKVGGVTRLPVGIFRCPTCSRRPEKLDGVPITYGCTATMERIARCFEDIEREYRDKSVKIFADTSLFDDKDRLTDVYKSIRSGGRLGDGGSIDVFDPAFRDTSLFNRLEHYFALLEKEVGTSRGILTDLASAGATATEIKRAMQATFSICSDIHEGVERYFNDLMYGCSVIANAFGLTPESDYAVVFDWSYSMLEDSAETFRQLIEAQKIGAVATEEVRRYVKPSETADEAAEAVAAIRQAGGGAAEAEIASKIWQAEVAGGMMSPAEYRVRRQYEENEAEAAKKLPASIDEGEF